MNRPVLRPRVGELFDLVWEARTDRLGEEHVYDDLTGWTAFYELMHAALTLAEHDAITDDLTLDQLGHLHRSIVYVANRVGVELELRRTIEGGHTSGGTGDTGA